MLHLLWGKVALFCTGGKWCYICTGESVGGNSVTFFSGESGVTLMREGGVTFVLGKAVLHLYRGEVVLRLHRGVGEGGEFFNICSVESFDIT